MPKFCKDCKYYMPDTDFAWCTHQKACSDNLVSGHQQFTPCVVMRMYVGDCHPNADLFEPIDHD